ncbi:MULTISPECIES: acyl carrier protein [unclassified Streptomyces]|uniref:acyl carrier protein n=1 Tax=unclassified Streptomyces TaxID=2593676 RepID=UPI002DDBBA03|nr:MULTISPECIES: acyl carrier protein [unclassified Streptomyces]WSA90500.1 acyl carrier protein [Streptomyces sp. NBC_01795]WSB74825.1 acyl carrier protein [Streptomyces sp. NBC_01775]WSS16892.1 acyl carrier protein [Streptomyces sp. NBC_01186]WSS45635.1 acyl carrier protein [Streptomyces sp. NBC_01187]
MPEKPAKAPDRDELRGIVAEVLDLDTSDVTDDARFNEDLGGDSLLALEVIVVLEKRYGVKFDESELRMLRTLAETHGLLAAKLAAV